MTLCARAPSTPQRAQCVSRLPALRGHRRSRLGLDTHEHAATLGRPEPQPYRRFTTDGRRAAHRSAQPVVVRNWRKGLALVRPHTRALPLAQALPRALPLPLPRSERSKLARQAPSYGSSQEQQPSRLPAARRLGQSQSCLGRNHPARAQLPPALRVSFVPVPDSGTPRLARRPPFHPCSSRASLCE